MTDPIEIFICEYRAKTKQGYVCEFCHNGNVCDGDCLMGRKKKEND